MFDLVLIPFLLEGQLKGAENSGFSAQNCLLKLQEKHLVAPPSLNISHSNNDNQIKSQQQLFRLQGNRAQETRRERHYISGRPVDSG
jgi:hypothetical protein